MISPALPGPPRSSLEGDNDAFDATVMAPPADPAAGLATAETHVAASGSGASIAPLTTGARTTVLPRIDGDGARVRLVQEVRPRYEQLKLIGSGGMGEVLLVHDQDIARKVAVKRLLPEMEDPAVLARFVDEIRTVGRLEHPNIVPIHDVGVDAEGRYFFVMKYVEGETLEAIIAKLQAGDPAYHAKFTPELRAEIFIDVLHALAYAHANGVVHRDIKPANVMVGRYGEVVLMDWGIARPLAATRDLAASAVEATVGEAEATSRGRMYATRVGTLVGTPAYMAPEQARGESHRIDERSDLYSACALFLELLSLEHYLPPQTSVNGLLDAVMNHEVSFWHLRSRRSPHQPKVPAELLHFCVRGLAKDPGRRHASATAMIDTLQRMIEGRLDVNCHVTLMKRSLREATRWVDRSPRLSLLVFTGILAALVFSGVALVRMAIA